MSEAKKLRKPPAAMGNRELVELFIGCLADPLASVVLQYLGNKSADLKTGSGNDKAAETSGKVVPRRPEDKYDLEDICKAALQVSENSQGMFNLMNQTEERGVLLYTQPVTENRTLSEKLSELEEEQALDKDRLVSLGKTLDTRMGGLEEMLKTLMKHGQANETQGDCKGGNCKTHEASSHPVQRWGGKSLDNEKCFWCGLFGHFQADCEDLKSQVKMGNIKMNHEGKIKAQGWFLYPKVPCRSQS